MIFEHKSYVDCHNRNCDTRKTKCHSRNFTKHSLRVSLSWARIMISRKESFGSISVVVIFFAGLTISIVSIYVRNDLSLSLFLLSFLLSLSPLSLSCRFTFNVNFLNVGRPTTTKQCKNRAAIQNALNFFPTTPSLPIPRSDSKKHYPLFLKISITLTSLSALAINKKDI